MRNAFLFTSLAILTACSLTTEGMPVGMKWFDFQNSKFLIPKESSIFATGDQNRKIIDNDFNDNDLDLPEEYRIQIISTAPPCIPLTLGVFSTQSLILPDGTTAMWGWVERRSMHDPNPDALCHYPQTKECSGPEWKERPCEDAAGAYGFCAEKNGKRVVICIEQMTKDETMAKQIFESFRWTE